MKKKKKFFPTDFFLSFSCWWTLVFLHPVITLFAIFQSITILKYLLNKRLDSLKDLTWTFLDDRNSKNLKSLSDKLKNSKKLKNIENSSQEQQKRNISIFFLNSKKLFKVEEISESDSTNFSVDFDLEDTKEIKKMIFKIKLAKFFTSNWFVLIVTFFFVIVF